MVVREDITVVGNNETGAGGLVGVAVAVKTAGHAAGGNANGRVQR